MKDIQILKLEGRSGCKLEVLNREGVFFVKKISKEQNYNSRLLLQAEKQHEFSLQENSIGFKAPPVLQRSYFTDSLTWFEMPYIHGQKYSEFFERSTIHDVKQLAIKFHRYFNLELEKSKISEIDPRIFLSKLETVHVLLLNRLDINQRLVENVADYLKEIPATRMPLRSCHGDFTFSNMMFCDDTVYLVDFLDSFVESPLIDLVKFRQDTFFYWSLLIENQLPESRAGKVIQIFNYLDQQIFGALADNKFVKEWYNYLQVFNLLRILPYVKHQREINFVQKSIQHIIQAK